MFVRETICSLADAIPKVDYAV